MSDDKQLAIIEEVKKAFDAKMSKITQLISKKQECRNYVMAGLQAIDDCIGLLTEIEHLEHVGKPVSGAARQISVPTGRVSRKNIKLLSPLALAILKVLQSSEKGMNKRDITKAVLKAGYKTASKNFENVVSQYLSTRSLGLRQYLDFKNRLFTVKPSYMGALQ